MQFLVDEPKSGLLCGDADERVTGFQVTSLVRLIGAENCEKRDRREVRNSVVTDLCEIVGIKQQFTKVAAQEKRVNGNYYSRILKKK
ncbi:hypothetical protein OSTOST_14520 [Ostertagia ostertagi]